MKSFPSISFGFVAGGVIGLMVGAGQTIYLTKIEEGMMGSATVWALTIFFAIGGAVAGGKIAGKIEKKEQEEKINAEGWSIEEEKERGENQLILQVKKELGIWQSKTECFKTVRYWTAETKWTDNRNGKAYILKTARSLTGDINTSINGNHLISQHGKSANKYVIPILHGKARDIVFKRLLRKFVEDSTFTIEKLYDLPET